MSTYAYRQAAGIRQALLDRRELALIDVREEADFATAHPLFAVNLPLSKLELEVHCGGYRASPPRSPSTTTARVWRRSPSNGCGPGAIRMWPCWPRVSSAGAAAAASCFRTSTPPVKPLASWWKACVTHRRSAPRRFRRSSTSRQEVVIVDARRFDEYQTMSIPGSISVPGGELALRVESLTPSPQTAGYRQLRRTHPQHHRHPVADQQRRAKPGPCPAQWHYRLDAG